MRREIHQQIRKWGLIALLATLPFSLFINALCIGLLVLNRILDNAEGNSFAASVMQPFVLLTSCYFLFLLVRCGFSENPVAAFKITERKASFLLLPLALLTQKAPDKGTLETAARVFAWAVFAAAAYCLLIAGIDLYHLGDSQRFFYHALGAPLRLHAVYFSLLILMALLLLQHFLPKRKENIFLGIFLSGTLLLLGSKLFILLGLLYACWLIVWKNRPAFGMPLRLLLGLLPVVLVAAVYILPNPIGKRFRDLSFQRFEWIRADHIGDDVYLDGLTLRLLQARLALDIASENQNWLWGTGPDKAQTTLDARYRELAMYAGDGKDDTGIIGYNFHNQFFETLVQAGIIPVLLLVSLFIWLLKEAWKRKSEGFFFSTLAFAVFCLSESVFERQLGVVAFVTFSSIWLLYTSRKNPITKKTTPK